MDTAKTPLLTALVHGSSTAYMDVMGGGVPPEELGVEMKMG
jgi:hypothetical protein